MDQQQTQQTSIVQPMKILVGRRIFWGFIGLLMGGFTGLITCIPTGQSEYGGIIGMGIGCVIGAGILPESIDELNRVITLPEGLRRRLRPSSRVEVEESEYEEDKALSFESPPLSTRTSILADPVVDTSRTSVLAPPVEAQQEQPADDDLFSYAEVPQSLPFRRLTLTEIVHRSQTAGWFNDFHVVVGRSLTLEGGKARRIGFYKKHLKVIGVSQFGKSSLVAYLLDAITQTHDTNHVQLAILDMEDMTGQLFANLPHIASIEQKQNGRTIKLHAHNVDEVFDHLGYLYLLMEYRYKMAMEDRMKLPLLLVYFEEFLAFKDKLKEALDAETQEERDFAKYRYATFMNRFAQLMKRGLKARMQFLLCAQVDYVDEDLRDAMRQVTNGFSFCLAREAAQAAGFRQTALISENEAKKQKGQCVAELEDFNDLILVPEYDLEAQLLKVQQQQPTAAAAVILDEVKVERSPLSHVEEPSAFYLSAVGGGQVKEIKPFAETLEGKVRRAFSMNYTTLGSVASFCDKSPGQVRPLWEKVRFEIAAQQETTESDVS